MMFGSRPEPRDDTIAVTLEGKVITCQNVSPAGTAPNGASHEIGNVEAIDAVRLASARHWSPITKSCAIMRGPVHDCDRSSSTCLCASYAISTKSDWSPCRCT